MDLYLISILVWNKTNVKKKIKTQRTKFSVDFIKCKKNSKYGSMLIYILLLSIKNRIKILDEFYHLFYKIYLKFAGKSNTK